MINLYSGTPGSGKSLHLAEEIFNRLTMRRENLVICNFPINMKSIKHKERFIEITYDDLMSSPSFLVDIARNWFHDKNIPIQEGRILLAIDEAQLPFNSRDWNNPVRRQWLAFFTQHRKFGFDCILVAQFDLMLDKQVRALIEYEYVHRKPTNFGAIGLFIKLFTFSDLFVCIERWYGLDAKTNQHFFRAKKKYYSLYDTFRDFGDFPVLDTKKNIATA